MRVLALTQVFPRDVGDPSGPFLLAWASALRDAGVRIAVIAPHDAGLPARHHVAGIGVRRARYGPGGWERLAYRGQMHERARSPAGPPLVASLIGSLTFAVRAQIRAGRPDVLHVHWWVPGAIVARLARPSIPVVVTVHGTDVALIESSPALAAVARWALEAADRVEAVSTDLAERLEQATGRAADAIGPMPLAAAAQDGAATGGPRSGAGSGAGAGAIGNGAGNRPLRVLAAGRLVPAKGFADLVEAVARLGVPARLEIVGDGPGRAELIRRAAARNVDLHLPGSLPPEELAAAYSGADVVAQPSHREGFGLVAAEALAAGVPVVATDSGGAREVFNDGDLVPVGDVNALAHALCEVAADLAAARTRAVARSQNVRALLGPAAVAARTLSGYRSVLAQNGPPGRAQGAWRTRGFDGERYVESLRSGGRLETP